MPLVLSLTLAAGVLLVYLSLTPGGTAGEQAPSRRSLNDRLEEFIRAPASDFPAAVLTTIGFVGPARVLGAYLANGCFVAPRIVARSAVQCLAPSMAPVEEAAGIGPRE